MWYIGPFNAVFTVTQLFTAQNIHMIQWFVNGGEQQKGRLNEHSLRKNGCNCYQSEESSKKIIHTTIPREEHTWKLFCITYMRLIGEWVKHMIIVTIRSTVESNASGFFIQLIDRLCVCWCELNVKEKKYNRISKKNQKKDTRTSRMHNLFFACKMNKLTLMTMDRIEPMGQW